MHHKQRMFLCVFARLDASWLLASQRYWARPCLRSAEYSAVDTVSPKPARFCVCRGTGRDGDLRWRCDHLGQDTHRSTAVQTSTGLCKLSVAQISALNASLRLDCFRFIAFGIASVRFCFDYEPWVRNGASRNGRRLPGLV